jgi:murein DD-endopeptidase MepM/ murein hydrolase activator NlpD
MKNAFLFILLCFCAIVGVQYISLSVHALFQHPAVAQTNDSYYDGLPSVNFNFFDQTGTGKSYITQGYGDTPDAYLYVNHWHDGVDIAANYGETIYSPTAGTVLATGNQDNYCYHRGFGKYVAVADDAKNVVLWYAHLGTIAVSPGETITKGTELGAVGATGYEFGVHLHFSLFDENGFSMQNRNGCGPDPTGKDIDPLPFLRTLN